MSAAPPSPDDSLFQAQIQRLHRLTVYMRWMLVGLTWLFVGSWSLWALRYPISLLREEFTWSGLRYSLYFDRIPAMGLAFCIGLTTAVLVWQSRNSVWGLSPKEKHRLEQQLIRIRQQGKSHPLWKWVIASER